MGLDLASLISVNNIGISGLTLSECGQLRNSTTVNTSSNSVMLFRAAFFFENVTNVIIDNVEVSDTIRKKWSVKSSIINSLMHHLPCFIMSNLHQ